MRHAFTVGIIVAASVLRGVGQAQTVLTPAELGAAIAANPQGADADLLAERIRQMFGGRDALRRGPHPVVDELRVAWAIDAPNWSPTPSELSPNVWRPSGNARYAMTRIGTTSVYAVVHTLAPGDGFVWLYDLGAGSGLGGGRLEVYERHRDSVVREGVPRGVLRQMPPWTSRIIPGTTRDWWVYVPAQYVPGTPAAVMVFQDGQRALEYVVPVFDNLIAQRAMPVTVGVFVEPGGIKAPRDNRQQEYDTLSDQYVRFLLEELLPEAGKVATLRQDPAGRAVAGSSSGATAAFTAAWERPDQFSKVLSGIGSFTNIAIAYGKSLQEGAHNYEALVRRLPRKPIRVFLQDGSNDLDLVYGSWWLANQALARSLAFAGYDYTFVTGHGFHSDLHMRAILPDALRWLWRGWEAEVPTRRPQ